MSKSSYLLAVDLNLWRIYYLISGYLLHIFTLSITCYINPMNLEDILKKLTVVGIFIVPFVPLFLSYSLIFPFITGKAFLFRIIVGIVFILWISLILLKKEYLPKKSWITFSVLGFLAALTLGAVFGVNPYKSFWSTFERMEGLITLLHLGAFFLMASSVFNEKLWKRFFHVSLGVSVIISFYAVLQMTGSVGLTQGDRLEGTIGNAIYLAVYMLFHIFISLYYFFQRIDGYKYIYLAIIALEAFVLYNTATRGVTLGLIGGLLVAFLLIFLFERERKNLKKAAGIFILSVVLLVGGFFAIKDSDFVKSSPVLSRFSDLSLDKIQEQGRFFVWPMAIEGFTERPIFGYGQENFIYVFSEKYNPAMYSQEPWFDRAHNIYLDWLIAGGILALIGFLSIIIFTFISLWKTDHISLVGKSVFSGLLVGYLFQGLFAFDNLTSYILFFSVIAYICHLRSSENNLIFDFKSVDEKVVKNFVLPALMVVFLFTSYFIHYKPLLASRNLILASNSPNAEESLETFEELFELDTFGNQESLRYLLNKAVIVLGSKAPQEVKQGFLDLANERISVQTDRFPSDARILIESGIFYNRVGQYERALEFLRRAQELSQGKQEIYFFMTNALFPLGEDEEAFELVQTGYNLEPKNPEAKAMYALSLLHLGERNEAEEMLVNLPENYIYSDDRIVNAFVELGNFQKVLEIWQNRVERDPDNIKNRQALVGSYLNLGQWDNAIEELQNIVEIEPNFKETADYAIEQIRAGRGRSLIPQ